MDRFLKRATPASSPAAAPSAKRPATVGPLVSAANITIVDTTIDWVNWDAPDKRCQALTLHQLQAVSGMGELRTVNTSSDWSQAMSTIIIRNTQKYTRNEIFELIIWTGIVLIIMWFLNLTQNWIRLPRILNAKFAILTAKLSRNLPFWSRNYREIDHFAISRNREIWRKKTR